MTIEIQLTKGRTATIDDCDKDLAELRWFAHSTPSGFYAHHHKRAKGAKLLVMHRVIAERINGGVIPTGFVVDHKNGITTDNRRENIRLATRAENAHNRQNIQRNNTSGFKGVHWSKKLNKWTAAIGVDKKLINLGSFQTPLDGHRAYCQAALKHHGEFASFGSNSPFAGWQLIDFERGYKQLELPLFQEAA